MDNRLPPQNHFRLGPFTVKGEQNLLETPQGSVTLLPKVMTLLLYLCRHPEELVSFDELNKAIWPREVVGDNAIYNLIGQLRKVLGDKAANPTYIQTVSKKGYRLLVVPHVIQEAPSPILAPVAKPATTPTGFYNRNVILVLLVVIAALASWQHWPVDTPMSEQARQGLKIARYQLYRGDTQGLEQAIEELQRVSVVAAEWAMPKLELAYAYLRMAEVQPEEAAFWQSKVKAISADRSLGVRGVRLAALLQKDNEEAMDAGFQSADVLPSARLAYARHLFNQGRTEQALVQQRLALADCVDCPDVYRRIATSEMVLGRVQDGFDSFARFRQLTHKDVNNPSNHAGLVNLSLDTLSSMARWQFRQPLPIDLAPHQRNSLALFYLNLGDVTAAEALVAEADLSSGGFFDLYTAAAIAGAKGQFEQSLSLLERRSQAYPDNPRFARSVVYARWQLGQPSEALQLMMKGQEELVIPSPQGDMPFEFWSLYGALQLQAGDPLRGRSVLEQLERRLRAGLVPGSLSGDIRLACVLAVSGKHDEALNQLTLALEQGWVSDFNQTWWYLQDSPYFRDLRLDPRFQQRVARYHRAIAELTKAAKPQPGLLHR